tara:strand:+ start:81 stop:824 length:744 start_codon:yes stop_codon:yes gene_type:complete
MFTKTKTQEIHFTKDYGMFKLLKGNRDKNQNNYRKLKKSIMQKYIKESPILVNEHMEIIDGQHRYWVLKDLGYEISYVIGEGLTKKDAQLLNIAGSNWSLYDFLKSYTDDGIKEYTKVTGFFKTYNFKIIETLALLSSKDHATGSVADNFRNGDFVIVNLELAEKNARDILSFKELYKGVRKRSFVFAMLTCFKTEGFDVETFRSKLSYQSEKLKEYSRTQDCLLAIQTIYNYNTKQSNKLRLVNDL